MPTIQLVNPGFRAIKEHPMKKSHPRSRRHNPSGGEAAMKGARLGGKALVGAVGTLVLDRVLGGLKKADGTPRLTVGQRTAALAAVAGAAAVGASMVDNKLLSDAMEGTALVAGGTAGIQYAVQMRLPERVEGLVTGQQQPAQTAPGGYLGAPAAGLFANPMSHAPSAGLYANPMSH
jgi:hypothetical protein